MTNDSCRPSRLERFGEKTDRESIQGERRRKCAEKKETTGRRKGGERNPPGTVNGDASFASGEKNGKGGKRRHAQDWFPFKLMEEGCTKAPVKKDPKTAHPRVRERQRREGGRARGGTLEAGTQV